MEQLNQPEEHEGEKYLEMLGLGAMAYQNVTLQDGSTILARDFLTVCGTHALPGLRMYEGLSPDDPDRTEIGDALRRSVLGYLGEYPTQ